jgi:hypothetical protein
MDDYLTVLSENQVAKKTFFILYSNVQIVKDEWSFTWGFGKIMLSADLATTNRVPEARNLLDTAR